MPLYGFNLQWMFAPELQRPPQPADLQVLDFIAGEGFNFVRFPLHYHFWSRPGQYALPDAATALLIDGYVEGCRDRNLHASLNLHQAPGYSVSSSRQATEVHDLWVDLPAQDAFVAYWEYFARRYAGISPDRLSFNLVNEPPHQNWRSTFNRERHAACDCGDSRDRSGATDRARWNQRRQRVQPGTG